ncbi:MULTISPECIES: hypothetical protein [unclassified Streptomyces]|uniref:hypothetical protein n=1 Tax=unclassified Streptomyces TaxID=2593676 RepID=UPI0011655C96|nr:MULTISPECIES: hypothetical protein [unclassified Streptomyces]NMI54228.1 hypothetical protein [Streptomyces sp. RLA2-12]QDN63173.1 hypothetical protein FNV67_55805 [Streptomyces sp. S1D4-20]QDN73225.1 hypothetical protein FNV66_54685 [Streptomyces sp. S1D4-14]QDO55823.1 hypothetical protein FNV60_54100 [Streptomyces sp. RLB3-5]QDO56907.1 hypothetical protein FNV59_00070 [Streptomyces sp. RLB1-8]
MARRDFEKIQAELGEIRQTVNDSATGLAGLHKDQGDLRRKVLETVLQGTTGLREENRELRRRQEKMLTDLADTRTGVEALRRELAQAFTHIVGAPSPSTIVDRASAFELVQHEPQPLEVADVDAGNGWGEEGVNEVTGPVSDGEEQRDRPPAQGETSEAVTAPAPGASASPPLDPVTAEPPADTAATAPEDAEQKRREDRGRHVDSVLRAAAIASARVICHRDTWSFLIEQTSKHPHFRLPERINDLEDGMIETFLSGRSVLAVLVTMWKVSDDYIAGDEDMATWALACAVYRRTQLAVTDTTHTRPDGAQVTTIILDDRPMTTGQAA